MFDFQEELKKLPDQPGVYIMHDSTDAIIYIGKAVSLRKRVRQYFQPSHDEGIKKKQMVEHIARFEYIITDSELEALVLECNLIKEHTPKYNTMLMDDKAYPFIKVTADEAYPRIMLARKMIKDKAKYFGPYTSAGAVKDTIELIRKLYHIRSCNRKLPRDTGKERPCLNYHIHQCDAPCQGYISQEAYQKSVQEVLHFLNGNYDIILKRLEKQMQDAAEVLEFEKAAEYRELLFSVQKIAQKQKITDTAGEDRDVIAMATEYADAVVQVFFIRGGRLIGRDHFYLKTAPGETEKETLTSFIKQFYAGTPYIPSQLMLPQEVEDQELLEEEDVTASDAFVALTDRDEDNLIISLYAMQQGIPKVVAKSNRQNYAGIAHAAGLDSVISPKLLTAGQILQVVRGMQNSKGSVMNALYKIADGHAEAMEFVANATTRNRDTPLRELRLKPGILVAVLVHQGRIVIPDGSSSIAAGDTVIVISRNHGILDLNDIFEDSLLELGGDA